MKYISIDIETTGINPKKDQILEIGAIIEDTKNPLPFEECPQFHVYIKHDRIKGNPYAIAMNYKTILHMSGISDFKFLSITEAAVSFNAWLRNSGTKFNVAGKNVAGFDIPFLKNNGIPSSVEFSRRVLDPAILYFDPLKDEALPNLTECLQRAGIDKVVTHNALEDAWDVIQVLRNKLN